MTDDKGIVVSRKAALETCGPPADKQASKESGEPHLTSSEVMSPGSGGVALLSASCSPASPPGLQLACFTAHHLNARTSLFIKHTVVQILR